MMNKNTSLENDSSNKYKGREFRHLSTAYQHIRVPDFIKRDYPDKLPREYLSYLFGKLDVLLNDPVKIDTHIISREVYVLGCLKYQFNEAVREVDISCHVICSLYRKKNHPFELLHPLSSSYWLRYLLRPSLNIKKNRLLSTYDEWVIAVVYKQLKHDIRFIKLRKCLLFKAFGLDMSLVKIALRARMTTNNCLLVSWLYQLVWQHEGIYRQVNDENPQLLPMTTLAIKTGKLEFKTDPVKELKQALREDGVSEAGWKYLCFHGSRIFKPIWNLPYHSNWDDTVDYLIFLEKAHFPAPPKPLTFEILFSYSENTNLYWKYLPSQFVALLLKEADEYRNEEDLSRIKTEAAQVLFWIEKEGWPLNKSQRTDWRVLCCRVDKWLEEWCQIQAANDDPWEPVVESFVCGDFLIEPLTTECELIEEGIKMHNCVADFAEDCREDDAHILSVRHYKTGKHVATIGLEKSDDSFEWELYDVLGVANTRVSKTIKNIADVVVKKANGELDDDEPYNSLYAALLEILEVEITLFDPQPQSPP